MVGYMTECITKQLTFSFIRKHKVTVDFQGGEITSDAGLLLVRQADNALRLMTGIAGSITDRRDYRYTDHTPETLLRQRTYQIVAGYEDCNDANVVRKDPALKTACGRNLKEAHHQYVATGQKQRLFSEGVYQAQSWPKARRVVMKAEWLIQGPNRRFVVTNLSHEPKEL